MKTVCRSFGFLKNEVLSKMKYYLMIIRDDLNIKNGDKISYFHILFEYSENSEEKIIKIE